MDYIDGGYQECDSRHVFAAISIVDQMEAIFLEKRKRKAEVKEREVRFLPFFPSFPFVLPPLSLGGRGFLLPLLHLFTGIFKEHSTGDPRQGVAAAVQNARDK